jgi:O-antigen ligase
MSISEEAGNSPTRRGHRRSRTGRGKGLARILEAGVWLLLVSTPLALGSVSERATAWMEGGALTLLILAWWGTSRRENFVVPHWVLWPAILFCAWSLLQLVPLPPSALRILSPGTHAAYARFLPGYESGGKDTDVQSWLLARQGAPSQALRPRPGEFTGLEGRLTVHPGWRPVSWYPWLTVRWLSRFVAYLAFLILVAAYLPERALQERLPWLVVTTAFACSVFGIIQFLTWNGKIYWVITVYQGHPFGPWVNSNHFSGYVEMALPLGGALVLRELGVGRERRRRHRSRGSSAAKVALGGFMLVFMGVALLMSRSRGGLFSLAVVACLFAFLQLKPLLLARQHSGWWMALAAVPLAICLLGIVYYVFQGREIAAPSSRIELSFAQRLDAWKGVVQMIASNPVTGNGLGTFALAYPLHKTYGETAIWDQAHNEYLQLLAESGCIGFGIFLWGLLGGWRKAIGPRLAKAWHRQSPMALAACLGVVVLLAHSLVDFNLQIPSNGLLFTFLAALLVAGPSLEPRSSRPARELEASGAGQLPGSP